MSEVSVTHEPEQQRYEAHRQGELAGVAQYRLEGDLVVFTHTQVEPAHEGQGIGSTLAQAALDEVREAGERKVRADCAFIASWIDKHPDYADLLA
ncbi:GNAT family N-acetyltransferase [Ornithinimicrobium pratense]|uniref:N-acetyltransferase n=1 Tax=Ornithinimicrobium pratense TaxID=2593973 RepID=A0A5J6V908_9MICO|nr:GNAT family N-acetyltransferase [Ornithinimicrobium pratense]QFG69957.1 N-acetyltransferase [Ornithinimicrobium pratense]